MLWIAGIIAMIVVIDRLEDANYRKAHKQVSERWARGDTSCAVRRTWYGWRVKEYGECDQ